MNDYFEALEVIKRVTFEYFTSLLYIYAQHILCYYRVKWMWEILWLYTKHICISNGDVGIHWMTFLFDSSFIIWKYLVLTWVQQTVICWVVSTRSMPLGQAPYPSTPTLWITSCVTFKVVTHFRNYDLLHFKYVSSRNLLMACFCGERPFLSLWTELTPHQGWFLLTAFTYDLPTYFSWFLFKSFEA